MSPIRRCGMTLARTLAGSIFLVAGYLKLGDPAAVGAMVRFVTSIEPTLGTAIAAAAPYVAPFEIVLGVFLVCGLLVRLHSALAMGAILTSTTILSIAWASGVPFLSCHCFGGGILSSSYGITLGRNLVIAALLVPGILMPVTGPAADLLLRGRPDVPRSWRPFALAALVPVLLAVGATVLASTLIRDEGACVPLPLTVIGRVVTEQDEPVPDCAIQDESGRFLTRTNSLGEFRLDKPRRLESIHAVPPPDRSDLAEAHLALPHIATVRSAKIHTDVVVVLPHRR
jgi:uncharacterized membrane protein YphA (DoxX/SURF4 family)